MLPTAHSEQQSTHRSRVCAMSVLRLLSACDYNIVSRVTPRGKHSKQKIGEKQKNRLVTLKKKNRLTSMEKQDDLIDRKGLRSEAQL